MSGLEQDWAKLFHHILNLTATESQLSLWIPPVTYESNLFCSSVTICLSLDTCGCGSSVIGDF